MYTEAQLNARECWKQVAGAIRKNLKKFGWESKNIDDFLSIANRKWIEHVTGKSKQTLYKDNPPEVSKPTLLGGTNDVDCEELKKIYDIAITEVRGIGESSDCGYLIDEVIDKYEIERIKELDDERNCLECGYDKALCGSNNKNKVDGCTAFIPKEKIFDVEVSFWQMIEELEQTVISESNSKNALEAINFLKKLKEIKEFARGLF